MTPVYTRDIVGVNRDRQTAMAKTKNPKPIQVRADYLTRFQTQGAVPMAERPLSVRLPADLDAQVRSLPNRTEWLRDAIIEKMQREADEREAAN